MGKLHTCRKKSLSPAVSYFIAKQTKYMFWIRCGGVNEKISETTNRLMSLGNKGAVNSIFPRVIAFCSCLHIDF